MSINDFPMRLADTVSEEAGRILGPSRGDETIGVAVSGGADSVFLLAALRAAGHRVEAASVDHALRDGSRDEAEAVAGICRRWGGVRHEILTWERPGGGALRNVQADARDARYALLADWARRRGIRSVALGHNLDDAAENFVMRKVGMGPVRRVGEIAFIRPMLTLGRAEIRNALRDAGIGWADDPSNENEKFRRVAVRHALADDPSAREEVIRAMRRAGEASESARARAAEVMEAGMRVAPEGRVMMPTSLRSEPAPVIREALRAVLRAVGDGDARLRGARLSRAATDFAAGRPFTLCGAMHDPVSCAFTRDPGMADIAVIRGEGVWDERWLVRSEDEVTVGPHRKGSVTVPRDLDGRPIITRFLLEEDDVMSRLTGSENRHDHGPDEGPSI